MCIYACVQRDTYIDICAHTQTHFFYKRLQVSIPNASKKKKNQTTRCIEKKSKDGLPFLYPTSFVHLDSILVILWKHTKNKESLIFIASLMLILLYIDGNNLIHSVTFLVFDPSVSIFQSIFTYLTYQSLQHPTKNWGRVRFFRSEHWGLNRFYDMLKVTQQPEGTVLIWICIKYNTLSAQPGSVLHVFLPHFQHP